MDKIYVNIKRKVKEKPEDFFDRLYEEGDYGFLATFHDKNCMKYQCSSGSERSFSDLFKIMRTYYSKITHKQLIKIIIKKCTRNREYNLIYCPHIKSTVLYVGNWHGQKRLFKSTYVDYNEYIADDRIEEIDKFTIYYLYKKLGYTQKEIKQEIKKLNK